MSLDEEKHIQEEIQYMPIAGSTYRYNLGEDEK